MAAVNVNPAGKTNFNNAVFGTGGTKEILLLEAFSLRMTRIFAKDQNFIFYPLLPRKWNLETSFEMKYNTSEFLLDIIFLVL